MLDFILKVVTKTSVCPPRSPPATQTDDLDVKLIQSTLHGNQKSFGELIQRHQPAIFRMVHRHLRQREEAEDVVQQIFLKAYQHLGNFRGESKFFTWLYTIALNLVRNHVRQRNIRRMDSIDVIGKTEDSPVPQWHDKSPSPTEILDHRWELERIRTAVESLSEVHRAIFTLHYFQYFSLKEVAVRVGRPVGTVRVYLHRARTMVLNQLQKQPKGSNPNNS